MKILHINSNYLYTTLFEKMIDAIDNSTHDVFTPISGKIEFSIKPTKNVYYPIAFRKYDRFFFKYKQKKIITSLYKEIDPRKYDIVHAHTLFTDGNIALQLKKRFGTPYIVAVRNTDVNAFFKYRLNLRKLGIEILKNAEKVVFISQSYLNKVYENYIPNEFKKEFSEKSIVIPNGIDKFWLENKFMKKLDDEKSFNLNLVYAGKIDKNKNIISTVRAAELLNNKGYNITLTIAGPILNEGLMKKIQEKSFVKYLGSVSKEQLREIYRENDVFVMASFKETFGLVYAEAMSQGLPVIYTKNEGFDGQFEEGCVGYHVEAKKYKSIADNIEKILSRYNEISFNCNEKSSIFDWDAISLIYSDIYREIHK